jgi:DNA-binding XRE family transcriptional regulator
MLTVKELRKELGLSQEAFGDLLALSKQRVCELEAGQKTSVTVALEIERLSGGRIHAGSLSDEVRLVDEARSQDAA